MPPSVDTMPVLVEPELVALVNSAWEREAMDAEARSNGTVSRRLLDRKQIYRS